MKHNTCEFNVHNTSKKFGQSKCSRISNLNLVSPGNQLSSVKSLHTGLEGNPRCPLAWWQGGQLFIYGDDYTWRWLIFELQFASFSKNQSFDCMPNIVPELVGLASHYTRKLRNGHSHRSHITLIDRKSQQKVIPCAIKGNVDLP